MTRRRRCAAGALLRRLGVLLLLAAAVLAGRNLREDAVAAERAARVSAVLVQRMDTAAEQAAPEELSRAETEPQAAETLRVEEVEYLGTLEIPALDLTLPVAAQWSYPNLKIAPCRYSGTPEGRMILAAHNYAAHFGGLKKLAAGDAVYFTDVRGRRQSYRVTGTELLAPDDFDGMESGEWDLTLFTCTRGGGSRIAVRCRRSGETGA